MNTPVVGDSVQLGFSNTAFGFSYLGVTKVGYNALTNQMLYFEPTFNRSIRVAPPAALITNRTQTWRNDSGIIALVADVKVVKLDMTFGNDASAALRGTYANDSYFSTWAAAYAAAAIGDTIEIYSGNIGNITITKTLNIHCSPGVTFAGSVVVSGVNVTVKFTGSALFRGIIDLSGTDSVLGIYGDHEYLTTTQSGVGSIPIAVYGTNCRMDLQFTRLTSAAYNTFAIAGTDCRLEVNVLGVTTLNHTTFGLNNFVRVNDFATNPIVRVNFFDDIYSIRAGFAWVRNFITNCDIVFDLHGNTLYKSSFAPGFSDSSLVQAYNFVSGNLTILGNVQYTGPDKGVYEPAVIDQAEDLNIYIKGNWIGLFPGIYEGGDGQGNPSTGKEVIFKGNFSSNGAIAAYSVQPTNIVKFMDGTLETNGFVYITGNAFTQTPGLKASAIILGAPNFWPPSSNLTPLYLERVNLVNLNASNVHGLISYGVANPAQTGIAYITRCNFINSNLTAFEGRVISQPFCVTGSLLFTPAAGVDGLYLNVATTNIGGIGYGLTYDVTVAGGVITAISINNQGTGYLGGDSVSLIGYPGSVVNIISTATKPVESVDNLGNVDFGADMINVFTVFEAAGRGYLQDSLYTKTNFTKNF